MAPAGYLGTPLPRKLGLEEGATPVLLFCRNTVAPEKALSTVSRKLQAVGSLWISWPKKSSGSSFGLTVDGIRAIVLPTGLVNVKVCALNEAWSGLKLMVRKEKRESWDS